MTDALKSLHQILIDTGSGYRKAAEEADDAQLRDLFAGIAASRKSAEDDIADLMRSAGTTPSEDGSFMETVHRTVIGARAAIKGIDRDALPAFISGEKNVIDKFDKALAEQHGSDATRRIEKHKGAALERIAAMKRMSGEV